MKQIGLFLIFLLSPFVLWATANMQVSDSLNIFRNITDIEKLIQRGSDEAHPTQVIAPANSDAVFPSDTTFKHRRNTPLDSLYHRKANGTLQLPDKLPNEETLRGLGFRDTIFYNPLFLPMIFTGKILPPDLSFYSSEEPSTKGLLIPQENTFAPQLNHLEFVRETRRRFYSNFPDRVKLSAFQFDNLPATSNDKDVIETFNPFKELISTETSYSLNAPKVDGVEIGRKYWISSGEHTLQLSQSYFSSNWYKGGVNNLNFINNHILRFNYKKDKVRFNNTLEWRLSLFTAPDDTTRRFRIGDDLIRYFGDFGIDAFIKKWSYSANMEVKSQIFNNYPSNSKELRSAFIAPLYVNGGIGLKYNLDKKSETVRHRRVRLNLHLDPISFSLRYVGNPNVKETRYGIDAGKTSKIDLGSTVTGNLIYDFNRYVTLSSRLRYFTSYKKVEAELENSLNMALTNAFSTKFFLYLRYDDGVPPDPKFKHLQINQLLSFGLNYKW